MNARKKTSFSPLNFLALHSIDVEKLYSLVAFLISSVVTTLFSCSGSPEASNSSFKSSFVPTKTHGQSRAVAFISAIHFVHA